MTVTIRVDVPGAEKDLQDYFGKQSELVLTLDAPRIVIGRGPGCELSLPDPSVSRRHTTIRQRGNQYVILDEGSTNGTFFGYVQLSPHSPRVLQEGDRIRVGRVDLQLSFHPGVIVEPGSLRSRELALKLIYSGMIAEKLEPYATIYSESSPDQLIQMRDFTRSYRISSDESSDLSLEGLISTILVAYRGDSVFVRCNSNSKDVVLRGLPIGERETEWFDTDVLTVGSHRLYLRYPARRALLEMEDAPDELFISTEPFFSEPPLNEKTSNPSNSRPSGIQRKNSIRSQPWTWVDGIIFLAAIVVVCASLAGFWWLLRH